MEIKTERTFCAAHQLCNENKSLDWNRKTYGKCTNLHGHTWKVVVKILGDIDETGMLVNFNRIKKIIDYLDHKFLNDIPELKGILPTAENLANYFLDNIQNISDNIKCARVTVYESETSYAEVGK